MAARRRRCEGCGAVVASDMLRCPTCGHTLGESVVVEMGNATSGVPKPRATRRSLVVAGAVGAVLTIAAVVLTVGREEPNPTPSRAERSSTATTTADGGATTTAPPSAPLPRGPLLGEPVGLTAVAIGNGVIRFVDLDTGVIVQQFNAGGGEIPGLAVRGGAVLVVGGSAFYYPAPYPTDVETLGPAQTVVASDISGRVWLVRGSPGSPLVQETALDGSPTTGQIALPPDTTVVSGISGGLLVERHGALIIMGRDGTSRVIARGAPVAAAGKHLAYLDCDELEHCPLHLLDVETGVDGEVELPDRAFADALSGSVSPDGTKVLVGLDSGRRFAVVDIDQGRPVAVLDADPDGEPLVWSPRSDLLFWPTGGAWFRVADQWLDYSRLGDLRPVSLVVVESVPSGEGPLRRWVPIEGFRLDLSGVDGSPAVVFNGQELLVWGPDVRGGFDPVDGRLLLIVREPPIVPRGDAAYAWTGEELIVWGGTGDRDDGAAYNPDTSAWRRLAPAPISGRVPFGWAWTGTELVVLGSRCRTAPTADGAAYNPATDTWRRIAPAPLSLNEGNAVWTGAEMVVVGATLDDTNRSATTEAQALAYDPQTDSWRLLGSTALSPQSVSVGLAGDDVIAVDYLLEARRYGPPDGAWVELPRVPLSLRECDIGSVRSGETLVAYYSCGQAAAFDGTGWTRTMAFDETQPLVIRPLDAGRFLALSGDAPWLLDLEG